LPDFHARVPGDFDVLADFRDSASRSASKFGLDRRRNVSSPRHRKTRGKLVARDEIRLAVHFHEHAEFSAGRDVLGDGAFLRLARGFHGGGGLAFFAQNVHGGLRSPFASTSAFLQSIMPTPSFHGAWQRQQQ
jgi:hypothetical protein